ncbi:hypothetical protein GCM10022215_15180 [Nocardioides fonticola]|uniref:HTH cro/C1-type domain-containing protein n=1 Tax=Nocardioides fonticola TaxID=450363 RepID=A0ABP7XI28_9ACTN
MAGTRDDDAAWHAYARAVGTELHRRRIEAGLTQETLAHLAGMTRSHYRVLETGGSATSPANPTLRAMSRLAAALGIDVQDLLPTTGR